MKYFAKIANPLHRLTDKGHQYKRDEACCTAFNLRCIVLTEAPVLAYLNPNQMFILELDTSDVGLGAVLAKESENGRWLVLAVASLNPNETIASSTSHVSVQPCSSSPACLTCLRQALLQLSCLPYLSLSSPAPALHPPSPSCSPALPSLHCSGCMDFDPLPGLDHVTTYPVLPCLLDIDLFPFTLIEACYLLNLGV